MPKLTEKLTVYETVNVPGSQGRNATLAITNPRELKGDVRTVVETYNDGVHAVRLASVVATTPPVNWLNENSIVEWRGGQYAVSETETRHVGLFWNTFTLTKSGDLPTA